MCDGRGVGGGAVGAQVVGAVTAESPWVTNRTRGRTLCSSAEASSPALCGSRCEGQNTCQEKRGKTG